MDSFKVVDFKSLSEEVQGLVKAAAEARKNAYCPYSNFAVGAAIFTESGKTYTGFNIENVAFSPSLCAERSAVPRAICDGNMQFKRVAVVANQPNSFTSPCGVCRQTLLEFRGRDGDMEVYLSKPDLEKVLCTKLSCLLPLSFDSFKPGSDPK